MVITPTVGRIVLFQPGYYADQPYAAIVTYVHNDREINVSFFYPTGQPSYSVHVRLVQEGDAVPESGKYATWMPYQLGQAKKHTAEKPEWHISKGYEPMTTLKDPKS